MRVILAPMEGVADAAMRDLLTQCGGYDLCVSEFIRVVDHLLPEKVFYRSCPELKHQCKTASGTPTRIQLLGQHPQWLAENAVRASELGSHGVDLNFGCPAKTVNKSLGGAVLLKDPEKIHQIVKAVREALPAEEILSAKVRLGWADKSRCIEIAQAVETAGANELTVHARTKEEGYKPPAHWEYIRQIREAVSFNVIANGEIWNREDYLRCREISGSDDVMVGRGALSLPNLASVIKGEAPLAWVGLIDLMLHYSRSEIVGEKQRYLQSRIKQWLRYLTKQYPEADELFAALRTLRDNQQIVETLEQFKIQAS